MKGGLCLNDVVWSAGAFRLGPLELEVPARSWFVLLGPSGSGKTTLLRLVAGACAPAAGSITLEGRELAPLPPEARRVAYVSQQGDLFPHLTVAENVAFGLRFTRLSRAECRERTERLLKLLGVAHLRDRSAATVSGGEGRRVAVARALAPEPALLLLDEPLGMLDPNSRAELLAFLAQTHETLGTTTIHVTHDRDEAWQMGGLCGVILDGKMEQTGVVAEVFRRPRSAAAARFLGAINIVPAEIFGGAAGCEAMVRPEQLEITVAGTPGGLPARITAMHDRGAITQVELRLAESGLTLTAHISWQQARVLSMGASVGVGWQPESVVYWAR